MKSAYKYTVRSCFLGYITQAIVVNLAPLLFLRFQTQFGVSLDKITLLISLNFGVQILTDLTAARYIDRIGWRVPVVLAHALAALGLILMGILPGLLPDAYAGLIIATVCMAIGGGLIEVLISPIVESCPGEAKAARMSLLHSFYCWGQAGVVLLSTVYFTLAGIENWRFLPLLWAALPAANAWMFSRVPLNPLVEAHERMPLRKLLSSNVFWVLLVLMVASGASEQAMAQWSSLFAELGLSISKTWGDLAGPFAFAILMGLSRAFYGGMGDQLNVNRALSLSAVMCIASYLIAVLSPWPQLSLIGCALCGLSVGIMWPGAISLSARNYPQGGTAMFALLALAGDSGCAVGPGLVGVVSEWVRNGLPDLARGWFYGAELSTAALKSGLMTAILFPAALLIGVVWLRRRQP